MPNTAPILMYHRVDVVSDNRNTVALEQFRRQLQFLHDNGYTTISMKALYDHLTADTALPAKPVLLTFDDGYEDNHRHVLPLLQAYRMKAIVFPVAQWVGAACGWKKNPAAERLMNWRQLQEWQAAGLEIGAHTFSHGRLSTMTDEQVAYELRKSKAVLEEQLGQPVDFLCYPYGDFDARTGQQAEQAGYKAALGIFNGTGQTQRYALPRIGVSSRTALWEYRLKVSKLWKAFVAARRLEGSVKNIFR